MAAHGSWLRQVSARRLCSSGVPWPACCIMLARYQQNFEMHGRRQHPRPIGIEPPELNLVVSPLISSLLSADGVYQEYRVVGLLAGTEPIVSLERETKLLPPGTGAGEAAGSARWLLDGEGGGSPPSGSGSGGGRDSSSGNPNGNNNGGGGGMGFQFHGEHLEMSVSQSLSQSIMGGFG